MPAIKLSIPVGPAPEAADALADAVQRGDTDALQTLLASMSSDSGSEAALCTPDRRGLTPFHYAAIFGRAGALGVLLARCPAGVGARSTRGCTPLHHACRTRTAAACVAPLLAAHADAAAADAAGWTPLHYAAYAGCRTAAAALLLREGSSEGKAGRTRLREARTGEGDTPLAVAVALVVVVVVVVAVAVVAPEPAVEPRAPERRGDAARAARALA